MVFRRNLKCGCRHKYGELGALMDEINQMYMGRLRKIEKLDDHYEPKAKLLHMWVADLVDQNDSLVETIVDLEETAIEQVQQLEAKLKKSDTPIRECTVQIQDPDGHTTVSLRALVKRLEIDVKSLLELIRRLRTEGSWDVKGLVFHNVSYNDIFGTEPPPLSVPRLEVPAKSAKSDAELNKLKIELEFWKNRAETYETEARKKEIQMQKEWDQMQKKRDEMQKELDEARKLAAGKELRISSSCKDPDTEVLLLQQIQLDEMLASAAELEHTVTAAVDSLQQFVNKDLKQILSVKKHLIADIRTMTGRIQQLSYSITEELKSVDEQHPTQSPGTCMFDSGKMIAFQKHKVINLANYFHVIHQEVENVNKKLEESDPKGMSAAHVAASTAKVTTTESEDSLIEDVVLSFTIALGRLMEVVKKVNELGQEITNETRRHRDTREQNLVRAVKAMQLDGLQHGGLDVVEVPSVCHSPERLKSYVELHEKMIRVQDSVIVRLQVIEDTIRKQYKEAAECSQAEEKQLVDDSLRKRDSRMMMLNQHISLTKSKIQELEESICALSAKLQVNGMVDAPIMLTSLLSSKLDATRNQASIQQEKINMLKQSISQLSQHMKYLRDGSGKDFHHWWTDSVEVLQPVRCFSARTIDSELEACEHEKKSLDTNQKVIESKLANLQVQADSLILENVVGQDQPGSSTARIRQLEDSVREWSKWTEELKMVNMKQEIRVCELEVDKQNLSRQLEECKLELCSLTAERNQLRQQLGLEQKSCRCATQDQGDVVEVCTSKKAVSTDRFALCCCEELSSDEEFRTILSQTLGELHAQLQASNQQNANLQAEVQTLQRNNDRLALDLRLAQKALQDTVSAVSSSKKNYPKELEDMTTAYIQQEAVINRLSIQGNQLKAEVKALEKAKVIIVERNVALEKSNTGLVAELNNLKARLKQHEHQIELCEERWAMIDAQVRDSQRLITLVLKSVKSCRCARHSGNEVDEEKAQLQQQVRLYETQQQKLLRVVELLNNELQAIRQKHGTTPRDSLQSIVENLMHNVKSLMDAYLKLKEEYDSVRWQLSENVHALQGERAVLLQKLLESQHVNTQLSAEVERLMSELQMYVPTQDSDYPHQMIDGSSSQSEWGN